MILTTEEMSTPPAWVRFKKEGDSYVENGKFLKAIRSYDQALKLAHSTVVATFLFLARGAARLPFHAYDAALADAKAALTFPPADKPLNSQHEAALLLAAKADYGLRRFRESYRWVQKLITFYPTNDEGLDMVKRCIRRIVEQEQGIYDWDGMLKEARRGLTDSDHANYVGPIEVRGCQDPKCGRGLFVTKDVEPGELLLVEKAFSAAFAKEGGTPDMPAVGIGAKSKPDNEEENARVEARAMHAELAAQTVVKLSRNRSLQCAFLGLYRGPNMNAEVDERKDYSEAIQNRIAYNAFAFPSFLPASGFSTTTPSRGIWLKASYINHSCNPTIQRSFISDLIILRAQTHITRGTEVRLDYTSCLESVSQRRKVLLRYGFHCECERCVSEAGTSRAKLEIRENILREIKTLRVGEGGVGLGFYMRKIMAIDGTYTTAPSVEPRLALVPPLLNLLSVALAGDMHDFAIALTCRLLRALGFVVADPLHFDIWRWGFFINDIVVLMTDLAIAFEAIDQLWSRNVAARVAKKCYLIMCGEDWSWEEQYEGDGRVEEGTVEYLIERALVLG